MLPGTRHCRVQQVALQHHVVACGHRHDDGLVFRALRLVDGDRIRQADVVQFSILENDWPIVELNGYPFFVLVNSSDDALVTIENVVLVVVSRVDDQIAFAQ